MGTLHVTPSESAAASLTEAIPGTCRHLACAYLNQSQVDGWHLRRKFNRGAPPANSYPLRLFLLGECHYRAKPRLSHMKLPGHESSEPAKLARRRTRRASSKPDYRRPVCSFWITLHEDR